MLSLRCKTSFKIEKIKIQLQVRHKEKKVNASGFFRRKKTLARAGKKIAPTEKPRSVKVHTLEKNKKK